MLARTLRRARRGLARAPFEATLWALALVGVLWGVFAPLFACTYPPMTDLPMHASQTAMVRHWLDPAWHLHEQMTFHPLEVPYLSTYVLGALLSLVVPMVTAVKLATGVALFMLPLGLAVLAWGMKKSPLVGVAGLFVVWTNLTQWGFVNFVSALGLYAMAGGLALAVVDKPTLGRRVALALALVVLFFTHVFRFPFGVALACGAGLAVLPATRRLFVLVPSLAPSLALFAYWTRVRPKTVDVAGQKLFSDTLQWKRLEEVEHLFFRSFHDPGEREAEAWLVRMFVVAVVLFTAAKVVEGRLVPRRARDRWFALGAWLVPAAGALVCAGTFLTLPMQLGSWWYVYPREVVGAATLALGLLPDLPKHKLLRLAGLGMLLLPGLRMAEVVHRNYAKFGEATRDFEAIVRELPPAPKLLYLVFDHGGATRTNTAFIHLPGWAHAERGGWLSFHFVVFGASPFRYRDRREPGAVVPPPMMTRWEWRPDAFRMRDHGAFFDWFLVRKRSNPAALFASDPRVELVAHEGTWWLFARRP